MSASQQPRSSPAHLVYKFGCGVQGILNLSSQLDAKQLSSRQRDRLRERLHELDTTLWPEEPRGDVTERSDTALAAAHATIEQLQKDLRAAQTAAETKAAGSSRGSLLNRIVIRPKEPSMQWSYDSLFSRYFPGVTDITIYEPYLSSRHQILNLQDFLEMAVRATGGQLRQAVIYTSETSNVQEEAFARLKRQAADSGRTLQVHFLPRLHNREIVLSNGVVIASDRGLDLYEAPPVGHRRQKGGRAARLCKRSVIDIFSREFQDARITTGKPKATSPTKVRRVLATPKHARVASPGSYSPSKASIFKASSRRTVATEQRESVELEPRQPQFEEQTEIGGDMEVDVPEATHEARILERERARMSEESNAAIARTIYEELPLAHGLRNGDDDDEIEELRGHKVAVWKEGDLKDIPLIQSFSAGQVGDRRQASSLEVDGTVWIEAEGYSGDYDLIHSGMNYSSFQVSDWYHDLYVAHYLNDEDYSSESSSADDHQG